METATAPEGLRDLLQQAQHALAALVEQASRMGELPVEDLAEAVQLAAGVGRLADVLMMRTVHAVEEHDRFAGLGDTLAARLGMRNATIALGTLTGASRRTLQRWRQVDAATSERGFGSTGALPPLYPHLAESMSTGALSVDQALVIRQHLHQASDRAHPEHLDAAESSLVAAAIGAPQHEQACEREEPDDGEDERCGCEPQLPLTPELLAVQARLWRDAIDPDGPEPAYEQLRQQRSFTLGQRTDGMWVGRLLLPPDQGEALRLALDAHNAPRSSNRHPDPVGNKASTGTAGTHDAGGGAQGGAGRDSAAQDSAAQDSAAQDSAAQDSAAQDSAAQDSAARDGAVDAWSLEQSQRGVGLNRRNGRDDRTTAQRQADTLLALITSAITDLGSPRIGGEPATLVVTISQEELHKHAETGGGTAHLARTGEPIPAHLAARIMCDGYLQACLTDDAGLPLKLGRSRRSHTRHQRRALLTVYPGGCQNPGCDAPATFTEIHHPVWWSNGGATDTDNGIPVCQHCHAEIHAGRLRCRRAPDRRWEIVPAIRLRERLPARAAAG